MSSTQNPRSEGASPHLVVKFGGSLWSSPLLERWLAALRRATCDVTIVPGGGIFANAVRDAQDKMRFSNEAAHPMALLAMEQYALALVDLDQRLALVSSPQEARAAHLKGRSAVWRPSDMVCEARDVPASWDITSDSLAAWYAAKAAASTLLLVKSVDVESGDDLASLAVVDPYFPHYAEGLRVVVAGPSNVASAARTLARGDIPGTEIDARALRRKIAI